MRSVSDTAVTKIIATRPVGGETILGGGLEAGEALLEVGGLNAVPDFAQDAAGRGSVGPRDLAGIGAAILVAKLAQDCAYSCQPRSPSRHNGLSRP
jgi:hypothetical protein